MSKINRRDFLRDALTTSALLSLGCSKASAAGSNAERRFAPVRVSRDRLIREIVGLRPYREEGFVVDIEKVGRKTIIHNYGHGGAGITLSWGTAALAVDLARDVIASHSPHRHLAVIGCGVNGLSTARLLQRHFQDGPGTVTIYAKELPHETTSNIAGGFWKPTSVYSAKAASKQFVEQFRQACRISNREFQLLAGTDYGVRWIDTFELYKDADSLERELPGGNDLYPQQQSHKDAEHYFGFPFVRQYSTMLIEPSIYLDALLRDFYIAGGRVIVKEFHNREEIMRLPETVIFNCSGLGARALFGDEKLVPARGQLEVLLPQPEIDYCYLSGGYMFPRRDGIILGGTFDRDDWSLTPRQEQADQILEDHTQIMKALARAT